MGRFLKIIIPAAILVILGVVIYKPYHRWAREHVNNLTATTDHPLKCASCHLYIQKTGIISKVDNAKYNSPFNLAPSPDGKYLYVVAEEGNALLVVNTEKNKVTREIKVGARPHSVVVSSDGGNCLCEQPVVG